MQDKDIVTTDGWNSYGSYRMVLFSVTYSDP